MHFYVSLSVCGVFLVQRAVDRGRLRYVLPIAEHAGRPQQPGLGLPGRQHGRRQRHVGVGGRQQRQAVSRQRQLVAPDQLAQLPLADDGDRCAGSRDRGRGKRGAV